MIQFPSSPHGRDPDDRDGRYPEGRRGTPPRVTVLTRGWAAALAIAATGITSLVASPPWQPARGVRPCEPSGRSVAISYSPNGAILVAMALDGTIRRWSVDGDRNGADPLGAAIPGQV